MPKRYSERRRKELRAAQAAIGTLVEALSDDEPTRELEIALVMRMIEYVRASEMGSPATRVADYIATLNSPEFFALAWRMEAKIAPVQLSKLEDKNA